MARLARIRVILADDQALFRDAVCGLIDRSHGFEVVAHASSGPEAERVIRSHDPDVVVLETSLPRLSGEEVVRRAKRDGSSARFLFLSLRSSRTIVANAMRAGAEGFLCKDDSASDLLAAMETIAGGGTYLSPTAATQLVEIALGAEPRGDEASLLTRREQEVLQLIAEEMSSKEIAAELHISARTVESHRSNLMHKLGVHKVSGLVRYAIREGMLSP